MCRRVATILKHVQTQCFIWPPLMHANKTDIFSTSIFIITQPYISTHSDLRCEIPVVYSPHDFAFF